jgi:hypothetical protein
VIHLPGLKNPADGTFVIQQCVACYNFIAPVAFYVDWPRLMSRLVSAGLFNRPEQFAFLVVGPDSAVPVLDEHIGRILAASKIAEYQTVGGILGDRYSSKLSTSGPVNFDKKTFGAENNFFPAVTVPIVDLAGDIVVPVLSPNVRLAPAPQDRAIQILSDRRAGIVHVSLIEVLGTYNLYFAVVVHIACDNPLPTILRIESSDFPGPNNRHICIRLSNVFGIETGEIIALCTADKSRQNID